MTHTTSTIETFNVGEKRQINIIKRKVIEQLAMKLVKDGNIPPAMVPFLFQIHPENNGNIKKHFTM